jgi:hypothetical protein
VSLSASEVKEEEPLSETGRPSAVYFTSLPSLACGGITRVASCRSRQHTETPMIPTDSTDQPPKCHEATPICTGALPAILRYVVSVVVVTVRVVATAVLKGGEYVVLSILTFAVRAMSLRKMAKVVML